MLPRKARIPALLCVLLFVALLVYLPGLSGEFIFDDYLNIVNNEAVHLDSLAWRDVSRAFSSGVTTVLNRPLSMLTFAANHYLSGLDPFAFKLTNLLIHLATGACIFLLSDTLLGFAPVSNTASATTRQLAALLITACWTLHPLNVSSVLYVVQRMNQLATLATLFGLLYYCRLRARGFVTQAQGGVHLLCLTGALVLAVLFKENGALLVVLILLLEVFFFKFQQRNPAEQRFLHVFFGGLVAIPALAIALYTLISPAWLLEPYSTRTFNLTERLLTEGRALWMYIYWILVPDIREFTFYHDTYVVSTGLLAPYSTLTSLLGHVLVLILTVSLRHKLPLLCFGIGWFYAGHLMESTILALEPVFEHRNYLPGFGLLFGIIGTAVNVPKERFDPTLVRFLLVPYILFLAHGTYLEAVKWGDPGLQMLQAYERHPDSHRINYSLADYYLRNAHPQLRPDFFDKARAHYVKTDALEPHTIRGLTGLILVDAQSGAGVSEALVESMAERISQATVDENFGVDLNDLVECQVTGFCRLDDAALIRFFNALRANATATDAQKLRVIERLLATLSGSAADSPLLLSLRLLDSGIRAAVANGSENR